MSVMDALSVEVPFPSHKLDASFGGVARQHRVTKVSKDAVVTSETAGFEPRRGFQNRHVLRSRFGGVDHGLQRILRTGDVDTLLPVQHAALAGDAAETPFFPADGQVVILDGLYRETVLPQPNGGFFKETELRGFVLIVHCEVLLVSKKISRSILKCSGRVMDWAETPFLTSGNEKGRLFDGFDETNKQTPERSYEILRKDCFNLRPQKGRFFEFCP